MNNFCLHRINMLYIADNGQISKKTVALTLFAKPININDLSHEQRDALISLISFWHNVDIYHCNANCFCNIKEYYSKLSGEYLVNKHALYTEYIKVAMEHRMGLTFLLGLTTIRQVELLTRIKRRRNGRR